MIRHDGRGNEIFFCEECGQGISGAIYEVDGKDYCKPCIVLLGGYVGIEN